MSNLGKRLGALMDKAVKALSSFNQALKAPTPLWAFFCLVALWWVW